MIYALKSHGIYKTIDTEIVPKSNHKEETLFIVEGFLPHTNDMLN